VANLTAKRPAGIDPITIGSVTLNEAPFAPIWAIMPFRGQVTDLSQAMKQAHGLRFPDPNEMTQNGDLRCAFSGIDQAFLLGGVPDASLSAHAALTEQSDAWTHLRLDGACVSDVLARLTPLDLSLRAFPVGSAQRSSLGHMATLVLRPSETEFEILVFRSMAQTAVHELERAMKGVAARQST